MKKRKMSLKINRLYIKNFKVFKEVNIDFTSGVLVVFDGPNGFGKSTIYDALELLITGEVRRYRKLDNIVDNREVFSEMPFYHRDGDGTPIIIKAEIMVDDVTYTLARKTGDQAELLMSNIKHNFSAFELYRLENYDDSEFKKIEDKVALLSKVFGDNYKANFEFLNYVEQEESYYMLKSKDKDRKGGINHLFNTVEFAEELKKITQIKRQVVEFKKELKTEVLPALDDDIVSIKEKISDNNEENYQKLLERRNDLWDNEEIDFKSIPFVSILGEEGVLTRLRSLVSDGDLYKRYRISKAFEGIKSNRQPLLINILKYGSFLDKEELIFEERNICRFVEALVDKSINSERVINEEFDIPQLLKDKFPDNLQLKAFVVGIDAIKITIRKSTKISKLYADMLATRDELIHNFEAYRLESKITAEECPLCGKIWVDQSVLLAQIEAQTASLKELAEEITLGLTKQISEFSVKEYTALVGFLSEYKKNSFYNEAYFSDYFSRDEDEIDKLVKFFSRHSFEFKDLFNNSTDIKSELKIDKLLSRLEGRIEKIDTTKIHSYYDEFLSLYFENSFKTLLATNPQDVECKIRYVKWKYSLYTNVEHKRLLKERAIADKKLKVAMKKEAALKKLEELYENSLEDYNKEIIKDIELLFHVYSGRILQDYQGGLGLFISTKKNGLRFVTSPEQSYDALFSMSAGQLSALIISFTLALNKKYSRNNVLLIDDPVQSMDEINITGFIELLRNEFSDRQMFISTHESMMSTYMRYKFEKYNLSTKRINVKEIPNDSDK